MGDQDRRRAQRPRAFALLLAGAAALAAIAVAALAEQGKAPIYSSESGRFSQD
jgi:hypothetical protein